MRPAPSLAPGRVVRGVIFDMDGLMLDTERISRDAWRAAAVQLGVEFRESWLVRIVGRSMRDIAGVLVELEGPDFPVDRYMEAANRHYLDVIHGGDIPRKPGLTELLALLDDHGMPCAVATSTHGGTAMHKLKVTGLLPHFRGIMTGDRVARGKPAPDIMEAAAALLGLEARDCIVLEDSENGIRAAHAAGAIPVLVPDFVKPSPEVLALAAAVFTDLHEVASWMQSSDLLMRGR